MRPSVVAATQLVATYGADAPKVVADYHHAFPEGSRAFKDLEIYAGVYRPTPVADGPDMLQRMEGRREMFQWIRTILSLTTEEVARLVQSNGDDDAS